MTRIVTLLGAVTAQEALDSAQAGRVDAASVTALADTPQPNGFPGFDAIWQKVFGIAQGILNPAPTIASIPPPRQPSAVESAMPIAAVAGLGLAALLLFGKRSRKRSRR